MEGGQTPLYRILPKLRGWSHKVEKKKDYKPIPLGVLNLVQDNQVVDWCLIQKIYNRIGKFNSKVMIKVYDLEIYRWLVLLFITRKKDYQVNYFVKD